MCLIQYVVDSLAASLSLGVQSWVPYQAWKANRIPMDKQNQRYKKDVGGDDMPKSPQVPTLQVCQYTDGKLTIPSDVRQHFMQCPLFGPEWRQLVVEFDKSWAPVAESTPSRSPPTSGTPVGGSTPDVKNETKQEPGVKMEDDFDWSGIFSDAPATLHKLKEKFGADATELSGPTPQSSFYLAPGPQLYLVAKEPIHIQCRDAPIIAHGAGSWLTGDKATKFESNTPDRGIPCRMMHDEEPCVFEESPG